MGLKKFHILIFLFFVASLVFSQNDEVLFVTKVSKTKIGINQSLKVEFNINKQGGDNFAPPAFKNFDIVAGPSSSLSRSWVNGESTFSQGYIYIIKPNKTGEFILPPASIEYNGKIIKSSNTVQVTVVSEAEMPKDPNDPRYVAGENIHMVTELSKTNPYVGEGIYVEYKLYFSHNIGLNDFQQKELPKFEGFWNQEIKLEDQELQNCKYKGEDYRCITLKKALLIPTKSGKLNIEPINMDILVTVPTGQVDFFGNYIAKRIDYTTKSTTKTVRVKPLPTEGKPLDFKGAVGDFDFNVIATRDILRANETTQIKVAVSGKGNFQLFDIPSIETPSELEVYAPERAENVRVRGRSLTGKIVDSYTVVPEYKGKYKIPKVSFSYFDLSEKKYRTITTEDLFIDVAQGKAMPEDMQANSGSTSNNVQKQVVTISNDNFHYIATQTKFEPMNKEDFFKSNLFYLLIFIPFLAIPIGIFIGLKKEARDRDVVGTRSRKADRLAKKYLSQAKKQLGKKEAFYIALEKALHNFLKAKLNIETSEISKERITEILEARKVDTDVVKAFIQVLSDCDFARYAPSDNQKMQEEFEKAKAIIITLDKQLR